MSKAVLLSIRPNWCKKIANLRKTVEIRKTAPNLEVPFKCYIYCTKAPKKLITIFRDGEESYDGEIYHGKTKFITWDGIGVPDDIDSAMQMVIGEFVCDDIRRIGPEYCVVKERLARLKQETLDNYRQYIGWVEQDGEAYAMELLRRCSEQALQEELKINDMRESKNHILPGGSAEAQRADMLRAMEAVSAKMAAERGITRQPLAVLSQSEISRRMSAI